MQVRVDKNHDIYRKVSDIMNEDDETDKEKLLQKFLDEKLSKKIIKNSRKLLGQIIDYPLHVC